MLDALETLGLLAELRTMGRVATRQRVTQSAVSKRIAMLEGALGTKLVEREGRHVRLTPKALVLVGRAQPLLAELRASLAGEQHLEHGRIVLGVKLEMPRRGARRPRAGSRRELARELAVLSIERSSGTHRALEPQLRALRAAGLALTVDRELQSYAAIVQLARAGLGPALVPWPLARALGVPRASVTALPAPGLSRPIVLAARKTTWARPVVTRFAGVLRDAAQRVS